jgi:hypothetical protein
MALSPEARPAGFGVMPARIETGLTRLVVIFVAASEAVSTMAERSGTARTCENW